MRNLAILTLLLVVVGAVGYFYPTLEFVLQKTELRWEGMKIVIPDKVSYSKYDNGFVFSDISKGEDFLQIKKIDRDFGLSRLSEHLEKQGYKIVSQEKGDVGGCSSEEVLLYSSPNKGYMSLVHLKSNNILLVYEGGGKYNEQFQLLINSLEIDNHSCGS